MKKFKKIIAMGCATTMLLSMMSLGVSAAQTGDGILPTATVGTTNEVVDWTPVPDDYIAPRVSYQRPTNAYPGSLATPFVDTFWNVNADVNTGKSDYYFSPSGSGTIKIWANETIKCSVPSANIVCYVRDLDSNWIGATITLNKDNYGNFSMNKTIRNIPSGTKVYYEFEVFNGSGAVLTGSYTTSW